MICPTCSAPVTGPKLKGNRRRYRCACKSVFQTVEIPLIQHLRERVTGIKQLQEQLDRLKHATAREVLVERGILK